MTVSTDVWGQTLTMSYDGVGNRTKVQVSFGGVATYIDDGVGNLTCEEFGGSGQTPLRLDFTYTALDQLRTMKRSSDLAGTTTVVCRRLCHARQLRPSWHRRLALTLPKNTGLG